MHAAGRPYSRMDRIRAQELTRRIELGESMHAAWAEIVTDGLLGYPKWRGRTNLSAGQVQKSLESFAERALPDEELAALRLGKLQAAKLVPEALRTVADLMRGDFGEGRVSVKGRGPDAYEVIEVDGPAARVRLAAARTLLEIPRVIDKGRGDGGTTVNVSQTVNTGVLVVPASPSSDEWVAQVEAENVRTRPPEGAGEEASG